MKHRIYLASSWRNTEQPRIVQLLRDDRHEVYDFRNPSPGQRGFAWRDCGGRAASDGPGAGANSIPSYLEAIASVRAQCGFALDKSALDWCDLCVLLLPCGRSAHLAAGYAIGKGKRTLFYLSPDKFEPELMYLLGDGMAVDDAELLEAVNS